MKSLVFLLVLANLLFYALSAGLLGRPDNPDAGRMEQQIAVDRIRLVSSGEVPSPPAAEPVATTAAPVCVRWEALSVSDTDRLEALLKEKFPALAAKRQAQPGEGSSWWVYIPPLPGKAEADKKAGELRQFGITDYFILQDNGARRFAISLGVFSSEARGQERLAELKAKGIKSALLAVRPGKETLFGIEASGPLPDKDRLTQAVAEALPNAPARPCK